MGSARCPRGPGFESCKSGDKNSVSSFFNPWICGSWACRTFMSQAAQPVCGGDSPTAFQKQCDIVARKASLRSASLPKDPADDNCSIIVPSLANNIFSTNRFTAADSAHSVSFGTDRMLRTAEDQVPLLSEHGLVWLTHEAISEPGVTIWAK